MRVFDSPRILAKGLLFFWAAWFTVVTASNVADLLKTVGALDESWAFASGNAAFVAQTTARYGPQTWANHLLFAAVIAWEALTAMAFWRAGWRNRGEATERRPIYQAFALSLILWSGFMLADEVCIAYAVEGTHLRIFVAQLVTLLVVERLSREP